MKINEYAFEMRHQTFDTNRFISAMNDLCRFYTESQCPAIKMEDMTYENRQSTHESFSRLNISNQAYNIQFEYYDYDSGSHYNPNSRMEFTLKKGEEKQIAMQKNGNTIHIQTTSKHFDNFCSYIKSTIETIL